MAEIFIAQSSTLSFIVLFLIGLSTCEVHECDEYRLCKGDTIYCSDSIECILHCSSIESCKNTQFICNSTSCTVTCSAYESCSSISIISSSSSYNSTITCSSPQSCTNSYLNCNSDSCQLNCESTQSCIDSSIICTNDSNSCNLQCSDAADSCSDISYQCDSTQTCDIECSDSSEFCSNANYQCSNTQCNCNGKCGILATTSIAPTDSTSTTDKGSSNNNAQTYARSPSFAMSVSSRGYHSAFVALFLFVMFVILYCIWVSHRSDFFKQGHWFDTVFSLLPITLLLTISEIIWCFSLASDNVSFSSLQSNDNRVFLLFFTVFVPMNWLILVTHIVIWYLYLVYYPSTQYLYYLTLISNARRPRMTYLTPIVFIAVFVICMAIIAFSMEKQTAFVMICVLIIIECAVSLIFALILTFVPISFVENHLVMTTHDSFAMKLLFVCGCNCVCIFVSYTMICVSLLLNNKSGSSPTADIMRVFQLLFELFFLFCSSILFFYICPSPELHAGHRKSLVLDPKNEQLKQLQEQVAANYHWNFDDLNADNNDVLNKGTVVQVRVSNEKKYSKKSRKKRKQIENAWMDYEVIEMIDETKCAVKYIGHSETNLHKNKTVNMNMNELHMVIDLEETPEMLKLKIFGNDVNNLKCKTDVRYSNMKNVPCLLIDLRDKLEELDGFETKDIFRKKSNRELQYRSLKVAIEQNRMSSFDFADFDVYIIPHLIKEFYANLPEKCLQVLMGEHPHLMENREMKDLNGMKKLLNNRMSDDVRISPMNKKLLFWLWNLFADVLQFAVFNQMSKESLAIMFAPALYPQTHLEDRNKKKMARWLKIQESIIEFTVLGIKYVQNKRVEKAQNNNQNEGNNKTTKKNKKKRKNSKAKKTKRKSSNV